MKDPGAVSCISGLVLWWQQVEEWSQSLYRVLGGFLCTSWHELPRGVETSHVPELGLQAILGLIPYWHGIGNMQRCGGDLAV